VVPQGTEVATRQADENPEVIFTNDGKLLIRAPKLSQLRRGREFHKDYLSRLDVEPCLAFDENQPKPGDTFYLGFDEKQDISGYILRLNFKCEATQAVGVRREDPPLVWECSLGDNRWQKVAPSTYYGERDTTGGLNNPEGSLVFYLPLTMQVDAVNGRSAYWLRCRFEQNRPEQGLYSESPRLSGIEAYTLGATTRATHAVILHAERLGVSNGEPGQVFHLLNKPVLNLRPGETVEVQEERLGDTVFVPWEQVTDFSNSSRYDRHFTLDTATGELCFGPAVRQRDEIGRAHV
jgi:predicted phage baseplate assembly protein